MSITKLEQQIQQVFENFISELSPLSNELINKEPKQGNWTIAQLAQHVVLATAGLGDEKTKHADRSYDQFESSIRETFLNDKEKFKAPEFINPQKKKYTITDLLTNLQSNRDQLIQAIREKELNDLCLDIELPVWGHLTRYEWLTLIIYHVQRHTEQLKKLIVLQQEMVA